MKPIALVFLLGCAATSIARAADPAVADLFKQAQTVGAAGKPDEALHIYEQIITGHPGASNRWFEAQVAIATLLAKKGAWDDAAKAAHLCLDGAPTLQNFDAAVSLTANILSAQDKNVDRANQFLNFQQTGAGTNPLDAVGYPSLPEREAAFATLRQQDAEVEDSHLRAMTYLLTGKPKEALAQFADSFRRSSGNAQVIHTSSNLVLVGLRAVRGHRVGLDKALQFVIYGTRGPDAKPGTGDDLADPFASYLPSPPPAGQGGLAMNADDLAALKQVHEAAQLYWSDPLLGADIRKMALGSLLKSTTALDAWDNPALKDEFLKLALEDRADEQVRALLISCAEASAQGRQLTFGPIHALWAEIDARNIPASKGIDDARGKFTALCDALSKITYPKIAPKMLTAPAKF